MSEEGRRAIGKKKANGEGSVSRYKDGRWCARHTFHGPDGRPVRRAFYGRTKAEALAKREKAISDYHAGLLVLGTDNPGVGEYLERWLATSAKASVNKKTFENYEWLAKRHLIPALGATKLRSLSPLQVQGLYQKKLDGGLSRRTVQLMHAVLRKALKQAVRLGLVARNVAEAVDAPNPERREMSPLTLEQVKAFLEAVRSDRFEALYVLAATTGMRRGEITGLRWQDVDLERGVARVSQQIVRTRGGLTVTRPKGGRGRGVKLANVAVEALKGHRERQEAERLMMGNLWRETGLVFTTTVGTPLDADNLVKRSFKPLLGRAGLPEIRFHDLRHTCATLYLAEGVNPKIVQEILGHANISVTMDTYSHVLPDMQGEAVAAIDGLFS